MDIDSISIFRPYQVLETNDAKITSVDHASKKMFVVGDSKGAVTLFQMNNDKTNSVPVYDPIRIGKSKITKVVCLSVNNLLVAALMDSNLYLIDFAKSAQECVVKGANSIQYWQGETKPRMLVIVKNKVFAYKLNFDAQSLSSVFDLERVGFLQAAFGIATSARCCCLAQERALRRFLRKRV